VDASTDPQPRQERDVLGLPVLLLNRFFSPVTVTSARRAFVLLYGEAGRAVDENGDTHDFEGWRKTSPRSDDDHLPIVGGSIRVPRVLHLLRYERTPRFTVRLTRRNLMIRDGFQCQYCAHRPSQRDLNLDHVVPRSRGGTDTWENLVVSCRACNLKKGRRTPAEAGMALLRQPHIPRWSTATQILLVARQPYEQWEQFLKAG
jgi:5-methylcytosine-specific restriction endonuclease McrA